jgi:iron complex transport system ATP-binding protein
MLEAKQVRYMYGGKTGLREVDFHANLGESVGIIGPNGSGKSTLLKLLSFEKKTEHGEVLVDGKLIQAYSPKERARKIAVLSQEGLGEIPFSVEELVEMGRYPHQDRWMRFEQREEEIVTLAMQSTETSSYRNRWLQTLSGGERQRVAIAKAYAQDPSYLLLDEPTSFLDLRYQWRLLQMLQDWRKEHGRTVIHVLHDINLAAIFCERIYLLAEGKILTNGTPTEVLTKKRLEEVYGIHLEVVTHPKYQVPQILCG